MEILDHGLSLDICDKHTIPLLLNEYELFYKENTIPTFAVGDYISVLTCTENFRCNRDMLRIKKIETCAYADAYICYSYVYKQNMKYYRDDTMLLSYISSTRYTNFEDVLDEMITKDTIKKFEQHKKINVNNTIVKNIKIPLLLNEFSKTFDSMGNEFPIIVQGDYVTLMRPAEMSADLVKIKKITIDTLNPYDAEIYTGYSYTYKTKVQFYPDHILSYLSKSIFEQKQKTFAGIKKQKKIKDMYYATNLVISYVIKDNIVWH